MSEKKREPRVSIRVPSSDKELIKRAAKAVGKTYKEFVRDAISVAMVKVGYGPLRCSHLPKSRGYSTQILFDEFDYLNDNILDYMKEASESM